MESEITKEYLLNKIYKTYSDRKTKCEVKPDIIDFKSLKIRVAHKKIHHFYTSEQKPMSILFDLTEEEYENIIKNIYEWKKIN